MVAGIRRLEKGVEPEDNLLNSLYSVQGVDIAQGREGTYDNWIVIAAMNNLVPALDNNA